MEIDKYNMTSLKDIYSASNPLIKGKLKNTVFDYSSSDSDTVTTQDPMSPYKGDTIQMSPLQWLSTYDKSFKEINPDLAAANAYYHPDQSNRTLGYNVGRYLNKITNKVGPSIGDILNKGPLIGGLASAAPGLVLGALGTGALNMLTGNNTSDGMLRNALLAALATGSLGAYSAYLRKNKPTFERPKEKELLKPSDIAEGLNRARSDALLKLKSASVKKAFSSASEAQAEIVKAIQASPGLSFNEKSQLIAGVSQLASQDLSALAASLSGYGGAAVGAIVARFLLNKGLLGTVLGAIFGGSIAKSLFGASVPRNDLGQPSLQGRTITGQII